MSEGDKRGVRVQVWGVKGGEGLCAEGRRGNSHKDII